MGKGQGKVTGVPKEAQKRGFGSRAVMQNASACTYSEKECRSGTACWQAPLVYGRQ